MKTILSIAGGGNRGLIPALSMLTKAPIWRTFTENVNKNKKGIIMDAAPQNKAARINLRVKSSAKDLIMLAAGFEGKTVSHFILTSALKCAQKTVQKHQMMTLNVNDSKIFFDALSAPVRFNSKLTAAFDEYDKRVTPK